MILRRVTAAIALTALILGVAVTPALAGPHPANEKEKDKGPKVSEKFKDMDGYEWGLDQVTKLLLNGIFQGRGDGIFAPGAKINHQEVAVATARLAKKDTDAAALTAADVEALLKDMPDAAKIASWAKASVAMLVKIGAVEADKPFGPEADATRLDVAVLLSRVLGYQAEAEAKMGSTLSFKDAHLIPAEYVGYVAVAVDHQIITGYDDKTFRPHQAVKRVEMAVMMGRALRLIDRESRDEIKGTVKSVDTGANAITVKTEQNEVLTVKLAEDASVFVNHAEKSLAALGAGMKVEIKLNQEGKAVYIEAEGAASKPDDSSVTGSVTALVPATATSLGLVSVDGTAYPLAPKAQIKLNGSLVTLADVRVGDTVKLTLMYGIITRLDILRSETSVTGAIYRLTPATASNLAKIKVDTGASGYKEYAVAATATIKLDGQAISFSGLQVGDRATLTVKNEVVVAIEASRALVVEGSIAALSAASSSSLATITVNNTAYPVAASAVVKLNGAASELSALRVGDTVRLTLGAGMITRVEATRAVVTVSGKVTAITQATASTPAKLQVNISSTQTPNLKEYTVAADAVIKIDGDTAQLGALAVGDAVTVSLTNNVATKVEVARALTVEGGIAALTAASATSLATIKVNNVDYPVGPNAVVKLNSAAATLADLQVGDSVKLTISSGLAAKVEASRSIISISGKVYRITPATSSALALMKVNTSATSTPAYQEYPVAGDALITVNNLEVSLAQVQVNDQAALTITNGKATAVRITRTVPETVIEGSVVALNAAANQVSIGYVANGSFTLKVFSVTASTQVFVNGQASQLSNIQLGNSIKATLQGDALVKLEVTR